jgi:hypothetical protein
VLRRASRRLDRVPRPERKWAGIGVLAAYAVVLPIGVLILVAARMLKAAAAALRRTCTILSVVALLTPIVAHFIWRAQGHHI